MLFDKRCVLGCEWSKDAMRDANGVNLGCGG